jgi:hypothetical protein
MKKIIILSIVSIITIAQTNAQITFGAKGGFSLASQQFKGDDALSDAAAKGLNDTKKSLPAFHVGVTADIPLSENIVIQPALQFAQKGVKFENDLEKSRTVYNSLELPINVLYRQSAKGGFYGGVGPYIGYAFSGKKFTKIGNADEGSEKVDFDKANIKRLDIGGNAMVGYELPMGVTIGVNYSLGLTSITTIKDAGVLTKNNYVGLSVGYKFKK